LIEWKVPEMKRNEWKLTEMWGIEWNVSEMRENSGI